MSNQEMVSVLELLSLGLLGLIIGTIALLFWAMK